MYLCIVFFLFILFRALCLFTPLCLSLSPHASFFTFFLFFLPLLRHSSLFFCVNLSTLSENNFPSLHAHFFHCYSSSQFFLSFVSLLPTPIESRPLLPQREGSHPANPLAAMSPSRPWGGGSSSVDPLSRSALTATALCRTPRHLASPSRGVDGRLVAVSAEPEPAGLPVFHRAAPHLP